MISDILGRDRDVAREAFDDAIAFLRTEYPAGPSTLTGLQDAKYSSVDDALAAVRNAEEKYLLNSSCSKDIKTWVGKLSSAIMHCSKVFDAVIQHHPEYVALVWGMTKFILTGSTRFLGIINHEALIEQFSRALVMIAELLPQFKVSPDLYRTEGMEWAVSGLYTVVLLFFKKAMKWYNVGPAGRAISAIFKPFELTYEDTLEGVKQFSDTIDIIARLEETIEARESSDTSNDQSMRLVHLETTLQVMQDKFESSHQNLNNSIGHALQKMSCNQVKTDQIYVDMDSIEQQVNSMHLKDMLDALHPQISPEKSLRRYQSFVQKASPRSNRNAQNLQTLGRIGQWLQKPQSPLLVLQAGIMTQTEVKRIALDVIEWLQPKSQHLVWYLSSIKRTEAAPSATGVLQTLIFQLMKLAPALVVANPGLFNAGKLATPHREDEWLQLLFWMFQHIAACFVVIEAQDVMRDRDENIAMMNLFQRLSQRLKDANVGIKLLFVCYSRFENSLGTPATVIDVRQSAQSRRQRFSLSLRPANPFLGKRRFRH
ncbi:unnamed protein product [Clonostachys rosea]|uniref:DUF7708 domain-containing protein n=1 Tax=Bionectria ochroleuca TaxID=29856 RepID=A0ABY6UZE2_BIOOC|nr:unnamed protein product [Clonostachys rosea]